jgi:alpha-mannosidase
MLKHRTLTEGRLESAFGRISQLIYSEGVPLQVRACHLPGEPLPIEEALKGEFQPMTTGTRWGTPWSTTWFEVTGTVPAEWAGREVVALVLLGRAPDVREGFSLEGLVYREGVPVVAVNQHRYDVPIARKSAGEERVAFHIEAAANHRAAVEGDILGWEGMSARIEPDGERWRGAMTPGAMMLPDNDAPPLFELIRADLVCLNREMWALYHDFKVCLEAMRVLPENGLRRGQLLYALNDAVNRLDLDDPGSAVSARKALREVMACQNGDTIHKISATGHAHIDTAWLWPLRETVRKCARTFATALAYMEEYPDYIFCCSQPQQYAWMKRHYPTIFEGIKAAVRRGQWEVVGSMWIEADCNLASGESLVRQILYGRAFFREEFGIETDDLWLPDVFGYCAALPQILEKAGIRYFLTQKISWNKFNKFPHHTFLWEGIDGTRVFSHFPPADTYIGAVTPQELLFAADNFKEDDRATRSLYLYGHGDGGGGPTRGMIESARRLKNFEGLPALEMEKAMDFFRQAEADARDLPVWVGELYLELHRGTYTTQAKTKYGNRKGELLLRDAEFLDVVARLAAGGISLPANRPVARLAVYEAEGAESKQDDPVASGLDRAWRLLLLNQFHDIIPGSSIHWVYQDAARDYELIQQLGGDVVEAGLRALAQRVDTSNCQAPHLVCNTLAQPRREVGALPDGTCAWMEVPACGYAVVDAASAGKLPIGVSPVSVEAGTGGAVILENGLLRVHLDAAGLIASLIDLRAGNREVIAEGERANLFQLHPDYPLQWDAWDVDLFYREKCENLTALESLEVVERGPLRAVVRVVRAFGRSRIEQRIVLRAGSARLDFETEVDWQEDHRLLKVAFPLAAHSPRATYEIQYGHVERPTHYNTSWDLARFEVCAHKWADLSEGGYGAALLNDCKYGYDIYGHTMRLSLLRAPTSPDPLADRGRHCFVYALLPHPGDFRAGGVIEEAYALNVPLLVRQVEPHGGELAPERSFFHVDRSGVVIEAIKTSESGDAVIVRCYEAWGSRGTVKLGTTLPFKGACRADLLENSLDMLEFSAGVTFEIKPFEIVTLKFQR